MKNIRPSQRSTSGSNLTGVFVSFLFAAFLLLLFNFSANADTEKEENAVSLTAEEQAWIDAHSVIRLAVNQYFEPRAYFDKDGILQGISVEYARLLEKNLD